AGRGAVDGFTVHFHPGADLFQVIDGAPGDDPLARRADVDQVIAALADDVGEVGDHGPGRFPVFVAEEIAPMAVERHAGLPGLGVGAAGDLLLLDAVIAQAAADAGIDDAIRLQLVDQVGQLPA